MEILICYAIKYLFIAFIVLLIIAFICGYSESEITFYSYLAAILWPVTIAEIIGIVAGEVFK